MPRNPNSAPGTPDEEGDGPRRNPNTAPGTEVPPEPEVALEVVEPDAVIPAGEEPGWDEPLSPDEVAYLSRAVVLFGLLLVRRGLPRRPRVEWSARSRAWVLERVDQLISQLGREGNYAPY